MTNPFKSSRLYLSSLLALGATAVAFTGNLHFNKSLKNEAASDAVSRPSVAMRPASLPVSAALVSTGEREIADADSSTLKLSRAMVQQRLQPVKGAKPGTYQEFSRLLTRAQWDAIPTADRKWAQSMLHRARNGGFVVEPCLAPGTPLSTLNAVHALASTLKKAHAFNLGDRWTSTATNASIPFGQPFTLTWNLAKDGSMESTDKTDPTNLPSDLQAWATTNFGGTEPLRVLLRSIFARYEALSGIHYEEVSYDDGAVMVHDNALDNDGKLNVRADIRIGGHYIDGDGGILAYNYYPNGGGGDLFLDTEDSYIDAHINDNVDFNVFSHEHGHGLGLDHVCPVNETKLMEPYVSDQFTGLQFDDILAVQANYGDGNEHGKRNNTIADATAMGTLGTGDKLVDNVSINGTSSVADADYYSFSTSTPGLTATLLLSPSGTTYLSGTQNADESCSDGTDFNPANQRNLDLYLYDSTGTQIAQANTVAAGKKESIQFDLSGTGPYTVKVAAADNSTKTQAYSLNFNLVARTPVINDLHFDPARPYTDDKLQAVYNATDPDGDPLTNTLVWKLNGTEFTPGANDTVDLSVAGAGDEGDVIEVTLTSADNHNHSVAKTISVVIGGNAPAVIITPNPASTNSVLTAALATPIPNSTTTWVWKRNGTVITGETTDTLDLSVVNYGQRGDQITAEATTTDDANNVTNASASVEVLNTSPLLTKGTVLQLDGIQENTPNNPGTLLKSLVTSGGVFKDADDDTPGVALTGFAANAVVDHWEYTLDGTTWLTFTPEAGKALLLTADETTRIRLVSATNQTGDATLDFIAWDGSNGTAGTMLATDRADNTSTLSADSGTFQINVAQTDLAPVIDSVDSLTATEDGTVKDFTASVTDPDSPTTGADLQASSTSPIIASVTAVSTGTTADVPRTWTIKTTLKPNANGTAIIVLTAVNNGVTSTKNVTLTVSAVNDAPTINGTPSSLTTPEDTQLDITGLSVGDVDNTTLTVRLVGTNGTLHLKGATTFSSNIVANGTIGPLNTFLSTISFLPAANFNGVASINMQVTDQTTVVSKTYNITVTPVNDTPIAVDDTVSAKEDTSLTIAAATLLKNDGNGENAGETDAIKISAVTAPAGFHGTVVLDAAKQTILFTPAANFNGSDSFTYTISDSGGLTASATVNLTVASVNDAPVFPAASFKVTENQTLAGQLVATDDSAGALTFNTVVKPKNGTLFVSGDGSFTYTPKANYNGTDSFKARATDDEGKGVEAVISITITPANSTPFAGSDKVEAFEDTPLTIAASTLLKNDNTGENAGEVDSIKIISVTPPSDFPGKLKLDVANQTILYTPKANFNGEASFNYTIQDSGGLKATTNVVIVVKPVNDAPVASPRSLIAISGTPTTVNLTGSDIDGDAITFAMAAAPKNGKAKTQLVDGQWVALYTSTPGFTGTDTFTIVARDAKLASAPATVTVKVTANHAPILVSLTPNKGTFDLNSTVEFVQSVRDVDGIANLDAVSFVISESPDAVNAKRGLVVWFDAQHNLFTLAGDDGKTYPTPVGLGNSLSNSQVRVSLETADVKGGVNAPLTLRWRVVFKPGYKGTKTLWSRAEDRGGLSAGYTKVGTINIGKPAATGSAVASSSNDS